MISLAQMEPYFALKQANKYLLKSAEEMEIFVQNVAIEKSQHLTKDYERCCQAFIKANQLYGCKIIRPLKKLCLRIIETKLGLCEVHLLFLKIILQYDAYPESIEVIGKKVLPLHLSQTSYYQYQYYCGIAFYCLGQYQQSNKKFQSIINANFEKIQQSVKFLPALRLHIFLNEILGKKNLKSYEINYLFNDLSKKDKFTFEQQIKIHQKIVEKETLTTQELDLLQENKLKSYYEKIDHIANRMRQTIRSEINRKNERIKATEIVGNSLNSYQTMQKVNKLGNIARYDPEREILNLNHHPFSSSLINKLISECFEMYDIISAPKKEVSSDEEVEKLKVGKFGVKF